VFHSSQCLVSKSKPHPLPELTVYQLSCIGNCKSKNFSVHHSCLLWKHPTTTPDEVRVGALSFTLHNGVHKAVQVRKTAEDGYNSSFSCTNELTCSTSSMISVQCSGQPSSTPPVSGLSLAANTRCVKW
jgi:hypothetical protein